MFVYRVMAVILLVFTFSSQSHGSDYNRPWRHKHKALVLDAYELNPVDWDVVSRNRRIVGFISKASDGLPPEYRCNKGKTKPLRKLCREQYRKYAITRELYRSRKMIARQKGIKWGAYHMGRPGNPIDQANHFISFADPGPDDLIALDIESNNPEKWISLKDAEIFARHIKTRLGRYPLLYLNGSTARHIAQNAKKYPVLSRLNLWYARYKPNIRGVFPLGNWQSYSIWQFAYSGNCNKKRCPYRVKGTRNNIDVNVTKYSIKGLKKAWPLAMTELPNLKPDTGEPVLVAKATASRTNMDETFDPENMLDQITTGSIGAHGKIQSPRNHEAWLLTSYRGADHLEMTCDRFGQQGCGQEAFSGRNMLGQW